MMKGNSPVDISIRNGRLFSGPRQSIPRLSNNSRNDGAEDARNADVGEAHRRGAARGSGSGSAGRLARSRVHR